MKFLTVIEEKNILTVKLNRPDVRNAFNPEMISEITQLFKSVASKKDLRAVVLRGEGKAYCAGADLSWMKDMVNYSLEQNIQDSNQLFEMFQAVADCSAPLVSFVHGAAFGGALGLIACSDIVVIEEKTQLCFSEVKLGIAPAVISAFVLKKCSKGKILPAMLSARVFNASEALDMGLAHFIASETDAEEVLQNIIQQLQECGPEAVRETKKLLLGLDTNNWQQSRSSTTRVIAERRVSTEGQEGLKAFLEKRQPKWREFNWRPN